MTRDDQDRPVNVTDSPDPSLERAWCEASNERPSARVDAAILAAARRSVADRSEASGERRTSPRSWRSTSSWPTLLAAASVAGLAFILVPRTMNAPAPSRVERPEAGGAAEQRSAESLSVPAPPTTTSEADSRSRARENMPAPATPANRDIVRPAPMAAPVPAPQHKAAAPPAEAMDVGPRSSAGAVAVPAPAREMAPSTAASADSSSRERSVEDAATPPDVAMWSGRIDALYASGDLAAAARELRAFRATVPEADEYLSPPTREWARTVQ